WGCATLLRQTFSYYGDWEVRHGKALVIGLMLMLDMPFAVLVSTMRMPGAPLFPTPALLAEEEQVRGLWRENAVKGGELTTRRQETSKRLGAWLDESKSERPGNPLEEVLKLPPEKLKEHTERLRKETSERAARLQAIKTERQQLDIEIAALKLEQ